MCNGIAIVVYEKDGELKTLCTGISSHDELCKLDEGLRYGKIEPWRFEFLYPCSLVYDRGHEKPLGMGVCGEQPELKIWDIALQTALPYMFKHTLKQLQCADLTGADLTDANLRSADLTDANLRSADLTDANFIGADLTDANFIGANLTRANLRGADLTDADLTDANLTDADLTDANLRGADLTGADLTKANLTDADLTDANLIGANLTRANLTDANLTEAIGYTEKAKE